MMMFPPFARWMNSLSVVMLGLLLCTNANGHIEYYDFNQGKQINDLTAAGKSLVGNDHPIDNPANWTAQYQTTMSSGEAWTNLGGSYTSGTWGYKLKVVNIDSSGWTDGLRTNPSGGAYVLGDTHKIGFANFHLKQDAYVTITFEDDLAGGEDPVGINPSFSLYRGSLVYQAHDDIPVDLLNPKSGALKVQNSKDTGMVVDSQGIRSPYRNTVTNAGVYAGQFNAMGDFSVGNAAGDWSAVQFVTAVTGYVNPSGDWSGNANKNTLEHYFLPAGNYIVAFSGHAQPVSYQTPRSADTSSPYGTVTGQNGTLTIQVVASVAKTPQTISFNPISNRQLGDLPFALQATSTSNLTVSFSSLTPAVCSVSQATVSLLKVGTCTIAADQAGDSAYAAASRVSQSFTVLASTKTAVQLVLGTSHSQVVVGQSFKLTATVKLGSAPTGSVSYYEGSKLVCEPTSLANAVSSCEVGALSIGTHNLLGVYSGDDAHQTATSNTISVVVKAAPKNGCGDLPTFAQLRQTLQTLLTAVDITNISSARPVWVAVLDRTGLVCAVAYSGAKVTDQWLSGRLLSVALANTANMVSTEQQFLSSANLYRAEQAGWIDHNGKAFKLDAHLAYMGATLTKMGSLADPLVGTRPGGWQASGGGIALRNSAGNVVGALGVAGENPCINHSVAWQMRHLFSLDYVPSGVNPDTSRSDNILFPSNAFNANASLYTHPVCDAESTLLIESLPQVMQ